MKKTYSKKIKAVLLLAVITASAALSVNAQDVQSYNDYVVASNNTELVSLAKEIHPAIYLADNSDLRQYGDEPATVIYTDATSIPMLYAENKAFTEVELITVKIKTAEDEGCNIDLSKLSRFENLKYILFVYERDECKGDVACQKANTDKKVSNQTENGPKVLFLVSVPK